ncbi:MAG: hypothetical protein ACE5WD_02425 [Candidatus Aminicenantia bacterium]
MTEKAHREIKIVIPEDLVSLLIPEEAIQHGLKAKKEILLAIRSLIDAKIEALDKKTEKKTEKKKKINIA